MPFLFVLAAMWGAAPDPHPKLVGAIYSMVGDGIEEGKNATEIGMAARYCAVDAQLKFPELAAAWDKGDRAPAKTRNQSMGTILACLEDQGWIITNFMMKFLADGSRRP